MPSGVFPGGVFPAGIFPVGVFSSAAVEYNALHDLDYPLTAVISARNLTVELDQ